MSGVWDSIILNAGLAAWSACAFAVATFMAFQPAAEAGENDTQWLIERDLWVGVGPYFCLTAVAMAWFASRTAAAVTGTL